MYVCAFGVQLRDLWSQVKVPSARCGIQIHILGPGLLEVLPLGQQLTMLWAMGHDLA